MDSGSDDEPEHLVEPPKLKDMIAEHPGMESEHLSHVRSQEICSQGSSSSDVESLALESIGSSDKESILSSDQEGSGSDSDKEGRSENVQKKRKLEKLPEIAEGVEEEEEYRKTKKFLEWWDRRKKAYDAINWDKIDLDEELADMKPMSDEELAEYIDSIPSPPANFDNIEGLDPDLKRLYVHDVDPELWEKYLQEITESDGFDLTTDPGESPYRSFWRMNPEGDPEFHQLLINLVKSRLQDEHPGYQYMQTEWVIGHYRGGWEYNITFLGQGTDAPDGKPFQARVYSGCRGDDVLFCRPKVTRT